MLVSAFQDTLTLLNARYKMIRSRKGKINLWVFIFMIAFAVVGTSYAGTMIKRMANSPEGGLEAASIYATTYLHSYLDGELGVIVSMTLGVAVISVMIAPFTGTSATSLISHHYLVSVQSNIRHRFTDSIITQFVSSISLLQLLTLTAVSSLLTLDGGRKEGVLYAWASWPVLVILSTLFVWVAEYLYRRFGEKKRLLMLTLTICIIIAIAYINPEQASTVFGIGTAYAGIIQGFHTFSVLTKILSFSLLIALWFLFAFIAYKISQVALSYPDMFAKQDKKVQKKVKVKKTSYSPFFEMCYFSFMQIWRNGEIRKPILMATGFSVISMFILSSDTSLLSTVVFIIPLMISLSWGSNVFGIMGNGLQWILSKPFATRNMLWVFAGLQFAIIMFATTLAVIPVLITSRLDTNALASFLLAVIACSSVMTRSAIHKSVHTPHPYKSGYRGEPILPPATLIAYTVQFSLWSGMFGLIVFTSGDIMTQLALTFLAIVWSAFRMNRLNKKFRENTEIRNRIIFTVSNS